ncbi:hypothetical protein SRIMM317S_00163 [Streptomyces rimosus subsp. rimosus]
MGDAQAGQFRAVLVVVAVLLKVQVGVAYVRCEAVDAGEVGLARGR